MGERSGGGEGVGQRRGPHMETSKEGMRDLFTKPAQPAGRLSVSSQDTSPCRTYGRSVETEIPNVLGAD